MYSCGRVRCITNLVASGTAVAFLFLLPLEPFPSTGRLALTVGRMYPVLGQDALPPRTVCIALIIICCRNKRRAQFVVMLESLNPGRKGAKDAKGSGDASSSAKLVTAMFDADFTNSKTLVVGNSTRCNEQPC